MLLALPLLLIGVGLIRSGTAQVKPTGTSQFPLIKNRADAPIQITDASCAYDDKDVISSCKSTIKFDNSGSWSGYCLAWNLTYEGNHQNTAFQCADKGSHLTYAPFLEKEVAPTTIGLKDKNGVMLKIVNAEVVVQFVIHHDGHVWGITQMTDKDGKTMELEPFTRMVENRKQHNF